MSDSQQTLSALEQLKSQLEIIDKHEVAETRDYFCTLSAELATIESKEASGTRSKLRSLATDLNEIEKTEFSFLKVFGLEDNELVHSSFLAWLLDPLENHGLGPYFVQEFLRKVSLKTQDLDTQDLDFSSLQVETERPSDTSRLDIRLFDPQGRFHCTIENKIWSPEGTDQTNHLYNDFHNDAYFRESFVFLTLSGKPKPKNPHFVSLTYADVLPILKSIPETSNSDARFLIRHYSNTLERLIMSEKFEGFSERTLLYYQYHKQIFEVRKAFDKDRQLLLSTLEDEIKHRQWWNDKSWKIEKTGGDIYVWKDSWRVSKDNGVYLQLHPRVTELGFSLQIYGEPSEFSTKFMPILRKNIDEKYPGKVAGDFRKTFGTGVSRFLEKEIHFAPTEKDHVQKIMKVLNEMVELFDKLIERSIDEFQKEK